MTTAFYNRVISNHHLPTERPILGLWRVLPPASAVFVNRVPMRTECYLCPDGVGHWNVLAHDGRELASGRYSTALMPGALEADSVRAIGDVLLKLESVQCGWLEWCCTTPIVPDISEDIKIQPLECHIREYFGYLAAVSRRPRARLEVEIERLPVSRARRMPPEASEHLASHTEDWERPLLRGILPKRVLAEIRDDRLDIYENRVVARLIDHLDSYLARRVYKVQRILRMMSEATDYSQAAGGLRPRARRIYSLWGEAFRDNESQALAKATLRELTRLRYSVLSLMDAPLYGAIPSRASVPGVLRMTNIFLNDQDYHRIALLWKAWAQHGAPRALTATEIHDLYQNLLNGFDRYCMLLLVRALDQLGATPVTEDETTPLGRGARVRIGDACPCTLTWCKDYTFRIDDDDGRSLHIVPLAANLAAGQDPLLAANAVSKLAEDFSASGSTSTLVLYMAPPRISSREMPEPLARQLRTVGNEPSCKLPQGLGFLPVSPWEIASVETVARAIRWHLRGGDMMLYPPTIASRPPADTVDSRLVQDWCDITPAGAWLVLAPHQQQEVTQEEVRRLIQDAERQHEQAVAEIAELRVAEHKAQGDRRRLSHVNQQKREARTRGAHAQSIVEGLRSFERDLNAAVARIGRLAVCPSCDVRAISPAHFRGSPQGFFECRCEECSTRWGSRVCNSCGTSVPFIISADTVLFEEKRAGWVDAVFGRDVLAVPVFQAGQLEGFVCPRCGLVV